jgi:RNA polymerase sigma factor (sigma-70 family)
MYRVALNVAISYRRRMHRHTGHVLFDDGAVDAAVRQEPQNADDLTALRSFIEELDPLPKALMLLYLEGYPHREIAETLGISESNVGTKINRIKSELRSRFDRQLREDRS